MSRLQNVWVSKCLDLYAVAQCLGGTHCRLVLSWEKAGTITMGLTGQESQSETLMQHRLDRVWPNSRFHLNIRTCMGAGWRCPLTL